MIKPVVWKLITLKPSYRFTMANEDLPAPLFTMPLIYLGLTTMVYNCHTQPSAWESLAKT